MTDDMLTLARANPARAGAANVEFLKGEIAALPLLDASADVVISNCVINLSVNKPAVLTEMFRVLVPQGWIGISDVVVKDYMSPAGRASVGSYVGCIAEALSRAEYLDGLAAAGSRILGDVHPLSRPDGRGPVAPGPGKRGGHQLQVGRGDDLGQEAGVVPCLPAMSATDKANTRLAAIAPAAHPAICAGR